MARLTAQEVSKALYDKGGECERNEEAFWQGKAAGLWEAAELIRDNLIQSEDESRAEFESWIRSTSQTWLHSFERDTHRGGKYVNTWMEERWQVWQGSRNWRPTDERDPQGD